MIHHHHSRAVPALLAFAAALVLAGCGGPSSPDDAAGITLRGTVMGEGVAAASGRATAATLTVTVAENPAITTPVSADGSFTLRGLPEGAFTLIFKLDGVEIGRLPFAEVKPNQEITLTVRLDGTTVVVVEEKRNGIGHGDVEIEGLVSQVLVLDNQGESRFIIDGRTVVARPGETAVREGNRGRPFSDVTVGRQVHVKGVWMNADRGSQPVLAREIKLQGSGGTSPAPDPGPLPAPNPNSACAAGGKAEVEGRITAKGGSDITVFQQGKGDYLCLVSGSTRIRKGNDTFTFGQLQVGWRVHVKGQILGTSGAACQVQADEVKVQQN